MAYTVQQVADLSGVTVKTLYHYQKVGLLTPESVGSNGYRYYGKNELERLQQILFYRELDFSLEQIKDALMNEPNRLKCLIEQRNLLDTRRHRLDAIMLTLEEAIAHAQKGEPMATDKMFRGLSQKEWEHALSEQSNYLKKVYDFNLDTKNVDAQAMNTRAAEAMDFMNFMAVALKERISAEDESVLNAVRKHLSFLQKDMQIDEAGFVAQCRFFLKDQFHREMLENHQVGLSYYICYAAEMLAETKE